MQIIPHRWGSNSVCSNSSEHYTTRPLKRPSLEINCNDIDGKDLRVIRYLNWDQTASVINHHDLLSRILVPLLVSTRLLISKIRKRQATFFGHVMRREKLENLVTTGMLEGKRSRGKQREKLIEGLTDWLKAGKSLEAIEATKDRKKWRTMIANAVKQGT
ncbi:hypothetical protein PoB_006495100 [Plakobranchus ocellatus]|uniref:Uncharacterized protein n=1 Tax=Plakobranchus ocellatus TaxID=259542 RepID=A0AAV4D366_9GAST|nr:hypothetical protein PoB_006495100 [Plakobranchus ocellatus]